jgi:hypothetical protein
VLTIPPPKKFQKVTKPHIKEGYVRRPKFFKNSTAMEEER